ncbi:MAG: hypothetical protein ACRENP_26305 [Longimicrobiales bacterium]
MLTPLPLSRGEQIVRVEQRDDGETTSPDAYDVALMRPFVRTVVGRYGRVHIAQRHNRG